MVTTPALRRLLLRAPENFAMTTVMNQDHHKQRTSLALRLGTACAVLGIVIGGILAFRHLAGFRDLLHLASYGHHMLPSLILGGAAVVIAVVEYVRTSDWGGPTLVLGLGVAAIMTPVLVGLAFGMAVIAMILAAAHELG